MNPLPARRPVTRAARLLVIAIALAAIWVLILSAASPAATRHVSKGQLSAAASRSGSRGSKGIAWYVETPPTGGRDR